MCLQFDEFPAAQPLFVFGKLEQAAVGGDEVILRIDLEKSVKKELKVLISYLPHWAPTSREPSLYSHPHKH